MLGLVLCLQRDQGKETLSSFLSSRLEIRREGRLQVDRRGSESGQTSWICPSTDELQLEGGPFLLRDTLVQSSAQKEMGFNAFAFADLIGKIHSQACLQRFRNLLPLRRWITSLKAIHACLEAMRSLSILA